MLRPVVRHFFVPLAADLPHRSLPKNAARRYFPYREMTPSDQVGGRVSSLRLLTRRARFWGGTQFHLRAARKAGFSEEG